MLYELFYVVLQMNTLASVLAVLLLFAKRGLEKLGCPRRITFMLWVVIAFRLVCPVAPQSQVSVRNLETAFSSYVEKQAIDETQAIRATAQKHAATGINHTGTDKAEKHIAVSARQNNQIGIVRNSVAAVWLFGTMVMFMVGTASYIILKRKLRYCSKLRERIFVGEQITDSFVFGFIRPGIYVPDSKDEETLESIILHEKMHVRRLDHITKIIAYILLSVHWFNPLLWLLFKRFSEDMEMACDESALRKVGKTGQKAYVEALVYAALVQKKSAFSDPVRFAASPVKRRIEVALRWKSRPKFFGGMGVICCACLIVACSTDAPEVKRMDERDVRVEYVENIETETQAQPVEPIHTLPPAADTISAKAEYTTAVPTHTPWVSDEPPAATPALKIKEQGVRDEMLVGYASVDLGDARLVDIQKALQAEGVTESQGSTPDLRKNFVIRPFGQNKTNWVQCDADGRISIYFDLNTESFTNVCFYDAETNEDMGQFGILTSEKSAHTFVGFDAGKVYRVEIQEETQNDWQIEGEYILY